VGAYEDEAFNIATWALGEPLKDQTEFFGRHKYADQEHASPADHRQQYWGDERGQKNSRSPTESNIGRNTAVLAGRPGLGGKRHS